jgi:uncharacterized membrane protein
VVLGFSGWLAGLFALAFLWTLFEPRTAPPFIAFGAVLLTGAYLLYRKSEHNAFLDQLALALSMAGQLALFFAMEKLNLRSAQQAAAFTVLQFALIFLMPNALSRLFSTIFATISWVLFLRFVLWDHNLLAARAPLEIARAVLSWLLATTPVFTLAFWLVTRETVWMAGRFRALLRPVLSGSLISLLIVAVASDPESGLGFWRHAGSVETNWIALWPLLDIAVALIAAWLAFRVRHNALVGVAIVAALAHCARFYYLLEIPLLTKSLIMVAVGAVLLFAGFVLAKGHSNDAEASS